MKNTLSRIEDMNKTLVSKKIDKEDKLLTDIANFLKSKGYKVAVIGGMSIRQRVLKYNFEFVVNFTGKKDKT